MKTYLLLITIVFSQFKLFAQANTICKDTSMIEIKSLVIGNGEYTVWDFKVDPDSGRLYYIDSKDCKENNVIIQGEFLNGKRHGEFRYYDRQYSSRKKERYSIGLVVHYENGLLNGLFVIYATNGRKTQQGNFTNGQKDGFFIDYDYSSKINRVKAIEFYQKDSLIYSKSYHNIAIE